MKAKEFKKYLNYALGVEFIDLDGEFKNNGYYKYVDPTHARSATEEERETLWEKEVIAFDIKASHISWGNGSGPKVLVLSVSNLTEEERRERQRQRDIEEKMTELVRLTGRDVILGDLHKEPDEKSIATFAIGKSLTIDQSGTYVALNGEKVKVKGL